MPNQYIDDNKVGIDIIIKLTGGEQVLVAKTGSAVSTMSNTSSVGIEAQGSNNTINVLGTVFGASRAISMGTQPDADSNNSVFIGETGYVSGATNVYAIYMVGANSIVENDGAIWNKNFQGQGIGLQSTTGDGGTIINTGTIEVEDRAIFISAGKAHIENSGLISGDAAIRGTDGSMYVRNTGEIFGYVNLSSSNDIFDTRTGKVTSLVSGEQGNDALYGSKAGDTFYGDEDNDRLYGYDGADYLDGGVGNDTSFGGNGNDKLWADEGIDILYGDAGNDYLAGEAGADKIYGGAGKDIIVGGEGVDLLAGGRDSDVFFFRTLDTGTTKAKADTILDFNRIDRIDLSAIDANTKISKDQHFTFIGTETFHGKAGELRYEKIYGDTYIYGDVNGDKKVDLAIHLDNAYTPEANYFVL